VIDIKKSILGRLMDAINLFEHTANTANALQVFGYVKTILYNIDLKFLQFRNHHNLIRLVQKAPKTVLVIVLLCSKIDMLTKNLFIQCYSSAGLAASNDILIISNKRFPAKLLHNLFIQCYSSGLAASNDILTISNKRFPAKLLQIFHQSN
jgi:hypothetical protein